MGDLGPTASEVRLEWVGEGGIAEAMAGESIV